MNYRLTAPAKEDLLSIWEYTTDRWNEQQADQYIDTLDTRFVWLTNTSSQWNPRPEMGNGIYTFPEQSHVIVFWELQSDIEILRVLHRRMDLQRHF